ncbi:hypothetical protein Q5752_003862 [Cryptotrichosporon argae]
MVYLDHTPDFRAILRERTNAVAGTSKPTRSRSPHVPKKKDEFLQEAYRIYEHLSALETTLRSVRKQYLSTALPSRRDAAAMSEHERDEIETRAKMILRTCRERVGALEAAEKPRTTARLPFATPAPADTLLAAHRASVVWTLTSFLARLSTLQTSMQEERAARRAERTHTLGSNAAREAAAMQLAAGSLTIPSADAETAFSAEQLQVFERENSALLDHMESQLGSVFAAEKSLLEISAMQTELVRHLVQQTEITDRLYDEAVGSVADMGRANAQLKKAKERGGEARLFLLIFLVGASLALLFLDWYA